METNTTTNVLLLTFLPLAIYTAELPDWLVILSCLTGISSGLYNLIRNIREDLAKQKEKKRNKQLEENSRKYQKEENNKK